MQQKLDICAFKLARLGWSVCESFSCRASEFFVVFVCIVAPPTVGLGWVDHIICFISGLYCGGIFQSSTLPSIHPSSFGFVFREPEQLILKRHN